MQVQVEFRRLADCPEAVPTIARWWFEAWGPTRSSDSAEALARETLGQLHRDQLPLQLVAIRSGEVVGTAVLKEHELKSQFPDLRNWLGNVHVRSDLRGRGLGAALVKRSEALALDMGITLLHLATDRVDGGLYARLGYDAFDRTVYKES